MSKKVIATCPKCGHQFIVKPKHLSIGGAIAGAIIGSAVTVELGPIAIGGAVAGGIIGFFVGSTPADVKCPECGEDFNRPDK